MPTLKIDGKEYDVETFPKPAQDQYLALQYVDGEITRLQSQLAAMQTARIAYGKALAEALINVPTVEGGDTLKLG